MCGCPHLTCVRALQLRRLELHAVLLGIAERNTCSYHFRPVMIPLVPEPVCRFECKWHISRLNRQ